MGGVAAARREVAGRDAVRVVAGAHDHRLGHDARRHVAQAHGQPGGTTDRFDASQQGGIRVELGRGFATVQAEVRGAQQDERHGGIDAGHRQAVDGVDAAAGREQRSGDRAPGIEEVQADGRRGAGDAVDAGVAGVDHAPAGGQHGHVDARAGVDVEHADRRLAVLGIDQALFDRERRDAREHVSAIRPRVHRALADADLGEQVVDVAARFLGPGHDGHLGGQRVAAADAVELQQVAGADGADQGLVTLAFVGRQPVAQEERASGGARTHQDARDGSCHGAACWAMPLMT